MAKKPLSTVTIAATDTLGVVQEDGTLLASGHLVATDSVASATLAWSAGNNGVGVYGSLVLAQDGSWTYALNNGSAKVQALAAGQVVTDSFTIKVTDSLGTVATQLVSINITGVNDAPVISFAASQDHGAVQEDVATKVSGTLKGTDIDAGTVLAWTIDGGGVGQYGSMSVSSTGKWTYALANSSAAVQALAGGEHAAESFTVKVSDSQGGSASQLINIDILGTNDAPVISAASGATEGQVVQNKSLTAQGQFSATDVDHGSHIGWSVAGGGIGTYGTLSVDQTGHWTYALANASAPVQALVDGQSVSESFRVRADDGLGGIASRTVQIGIEGSRDPGVAPPPPPPVTAAVADTAATTENAPVTINVLANDTGTGLVLTGGTLPAASGSFSVLNNQLVFNPGADFDHLAQGAVATVTGSYSMHDTLGTVVTGAVTITVTGTNDAPTLAGPLAAVATEDASLVTLDLLTGGHDVDDGAVLHVALATGAVLPGGLSLAGNVLSIDPTNAAFQALAQGETQVLTVNYTVLDQFGAGVAQTATITVTGTNDAPVVAAALAAAAAEDAVPVTLDLLAGASDVDNGAVLGVANVSVLPAGLSLAGHVLTIDPGNAAFEALAQGETQLLVLNYNVVDQFGAAVAQTATITVTGTNDAPVVAAALAAAAAEDAAPVTLDLLAGATDVDHGAVLGIANLTPLPAGLSVVGHVLTIDPADASFQSLAQGETLALAVTYDVVDQFGAAVAQSATITVTGTNDAPVVAGALSVLASQGDPAFTLDLLAGATDPDTLDVLHVANVTGLGAGMTLNGDLLTIDPTNAAYQALLAGQDVLTQLHYDVVDGYGGVVAQTASIDILGALAPPPPPVLTLAGDLTGVVVEAATQPDGTVLPGIPAVNGLLHVDGGDATMVWAFAPNTGSPGSVAYGVYGTFQVDATTGAWSYALDNGLAESLPAGTLLQDSLSILATDQYGDVVVQDLVINVTGANDAPVAMLDYGYGSNIAPTVVDPIFDGSAYDPDTGDVLTLTGANVANGFGGSVAIVGGQLVYDPGTDYASLGAGNATDVMVNYTVTDQNGLTATNQVDIMLVGDANPYVPGVKYGPFTVIDPAKATAQEAAIAGAVLGSATPGLHFDAGSLAMTAGASSAMFYDGSLAPLGIGSGLLITTGTVPGTANTATWFGQDNGMPGNPLLDAVVNTVFNTQSFDATTISFDFTVTDAALTGISFKAVFGSDEFPEWVDAFVDIAVVMVNGTNVALFNNDPGAPLSVIGSNLAANYFQDNTGNLDPATGLAIPGKASLLPIEYDGVSHVLNISAPVHLGVNTITIGIADTGDHVYDSGLFISGLAGTTVPGGGVTLPVTGTDNPDVLTGTAASETIDAKGGNDTIDAGGGNDSVLAGAGDDLITGGAGNDYIDGGTGANTAVYTGLSTDYHVQHLANGNYTVEDLRNGTPDGIDTLLSVQTLNFLDGSYAVGTWDVPPPPPASTGVVINGTNGDNIISPTVTLTGEPAVTDLGDTIYGNGGDDIITGGAGNDSIFGGDGNDQLRGGGGNDTLVGDAGHDELTGGSGADVFRFLTASDATVAAPDQILDFSHSDGDHIDLSALGVFSFAFGAAAFTGQAMELISIKGTDGYLVEGDINGDGMADFAIQVSVATKLIATDFIL